MSYFRGLLGLLLTVAVCCRICPATEENDASSLKAAFESITADELQGHVDVLADDSFEGREAGSQGGRAAGQYLIKHFQKYGLRAAGTAGTDGGFAQPFGAGYRNILGMLEGSDPRLKREVILVGAHYDHVGYGTPRNSNGPTGQIHNGADDNASGTAALLETIEAFTQLPQPPKRTIVFALWDSEEMGLLGSIHWTSEPTIPLARIAMMINMDMIGRLRDERLKVIGTRTASGLRRLVSEQNRQIDIRLDFPWAMQGNSDHHAFFTSGIPVLMLHTGLHEDYHRPSDDAHLVNAEGMRKVARLLFNVVHNMAERPELSDFRVASRRESSDDRRRFERALPASPPRLGLSWDGGDRATGGLRLTRVAPGSAAETGGLKVGDRLVEFAGQDVNDEQQFRRRVLSADGVVPVVVERPGVEKPLRLNVEPAGRPTRLGIVWRLDLAEPGTAVLVRVVTGSPAHAAGLRVGDRLYEMGGSRFEDSDDLLRLANTLPGPIELLIERAGRIRTYRLEVTPLSGEPAAGEPEEQSSGTQ